MRILLFSVLIIPKFRDSANWSRDTVQPMRRHAFVYQNVDQVLKNFHNGGRSQTEHCLFVFLLTDANCTRLGFSNYFKENIWCKRLKVLFIGRNCWGVRIFQTDQWFQWHGLQDFDRSKLVPCKNVSCFVLPAHMDFMHLVLSLLAVVPAKLKSNPDYQCSMSSEIHHLQLKFALFLWFFQLWMNVWRIQ